jgi:hypothetical protein
MKNLRFICAQPANTFYIWQVETVINNFVKNGINPNNIDILLAIENNFIPEEWQILKNHYNNVNFFFYNDTREDKSYLPGVYFDLLKHYVKNNDLHDKVLFLHDSDIVFTKNVDFSGMIDDDIWYMSDTNSYINYNYIKQKGDQVYQDMCNIVGIDRRIPKLMNSNSGGAQYIIKNSTYEYWDKVEKDSIKLYKHFCDTEYLHVKKHDHDYPIQKWTAGMWSLLWNAWLFGHETKVDRRLDFGWSTNHISDVQKYSILHNSGVLSNENKMFFKTDYLNKLPYGDDLDIDKEKASYYYWNEVQDAGKKSPMINHETNDKVSFVCTTYGRFTCVRRIVAQYYAQTYSNKELIIFNTDVERPYVSGINDPTIKVINNNTNYITNEPYTNRGDICRDAVTHATGDYFMLADDDDIYLPWHMEQAVNGIKSNGKDAWKPEKSFYASYGNLEISKNVMEASVIVKMDRIRSIGFRSDITGYEGLSWYMQLASEGNLDEQNTYYVPSYSFNWSDPQEIGGHKQSGHIDDINNFDNHKLNCTDYAKEPLTPISEKELAKEYSKYYDFFLSNKNLFDHELFEKYISCYISKPITGRDDSFTVLFDILNDTYNEPINIVETGCIREINDDFKFGDGWSTLNWEYYCKKTGSKTFVVDISKIHIDRSKTIVPESKYVSYTLDDSINFLNNFNSKIDLLYLDSFDYDGDEENIKLCHNHSLNELKAAWNKLSEKCFILIDDIFNEHWDGKGKITIPYLLSNGFTIVYFIDSQVLLKR